MNIPCADDAPPACVRVLVENAWTFLDKTIDSFGNKITDQSESKQTCCEAPEPGQIFAILSRYL